MEGTLNAFYEDDEVVQVCISLLTEFVSNRGNRMRFDTWNINGLVVFKESAKYIIKLLQLWDSLLNKKGSDLYSSKFKYTKQICLFLKQIVNGNYINFAICEYYNDDVFATLAQLVLKMIACTDYAELATFQKVYSTLYATLWVFFNHHMELLFTKIDFGSIKAIMQLIVRAVQND